MGKESGLSDERACFMTGRAEERIGLPDFLDELAPIAGWKAARGEAGDIDHLRGAESQSLDDQESDLNAGWSVDC